MIRVIGEKLKQYEKERSVEIAPRKGFNLRRVCFAKNGIWYAASVEEDGELYTAMIPDALLMATGTLTVRCDGINDEGIKAREKANFVIHRAKKPEGYVEPEIDMSSSGSGGVSSWNDLTDKPFYKEETEVQLNGVEFDGNLDGKTTIDLGEGMCFVKVSDIVPTDESVIDSSVIMLMEGTEEVISLRELFELPDYNFITDDYTLLADYGVIAKNPNITLENMGVTIPESGVWFVYMSEATYTKKLTVECTVVTETIKTLDKEYLPSVAEQLSEVSEVVILPETTLEFAMDGDINSSYIESAPSLEVGETYIVKWENVEYECTAFEDGAVMLIQFDENFNQISPFSVIDVNAIDDVPHSYIIETDGTETTYTVGIYQKSTTYTKLPEEVLPDLSDNYDLVIEVNNYPSAVITNSSFKITRGSVSDIFSVVRAGGYPKVKIRYRVNEDNMGSPMRCEVDANIELYDENVWISWLVYSSTSGLDGHKALFRADGTIVDDSVNSYVPES